MAYIYACLQMPAQVPREAVVPELLGMLERHGGCDLAQVEVLPPEPRGALFAAWTAKAPEKE